MKRGGGRRYYRPEDVALLRGIRFLLYDDGYTIRGVQKILREQGPRFVMEQRPPVENHDKKIGVTIERGDSRRRRRSRPEPQLRQASWPLREGYGDGREDLDFSAERARGLPQNPDLGQGLIGSYGDGTACFAHLSVYIQAQRA